MHRLAKTKQLALITDNRHLFIEPSLIYHNLLNCFDCIITEENVPKHKPDAAGIINTLMFFNALPAQSVMIGDSAKDLQAARNAGIDSILFYPSRNHIRYNLEELMEYKPKHVVVNFKELLKVVK